MRSKIFQLYDGGVNYGRKKPVKNYDHLLVSARPTRLPQGGTQHELRFQQSYLDNEQPVD